MSAQRASILESVYAIFDKNILAWDTDTKDSPLM